MSMLTLEVKGKHAVTSRRPLVHVCTPNRPVACGTLEIRRKTISSRRWRNKLKRTLTATASSRVANRKVVIGEHTKKVGRCFRLFAGRMVIKLDPFMVTVVTSQQINTGTRLRILDENAFFYKRSVKMA